ARSRWVPGNAAAARGVARRECATSRGVRPAVRRLASGGRAAPTPAATRGNRSGPARARRTGEAGNRLAHARVPQGARLALGHGKDTRCATRLRVAGDTLLPASGDTRSTGIK